MFQGYERFRSETGPKSIKGEAKRWKKCVCGVLGPIRKFVWPTASMMQKTVKQSVQSKLIKYRFEIVK